MKRLKIGLLVATLALVGAACGGGDTNATETPGATESSPAAASGSTVTMTDQLVFEPKAITVAAGTEVEWKNTGTAPHTVTAKDGSFDSGNVTGGNSFKHAFPTAGTFEYKCILHPGMEGSVTVS